MNLTNENIDLESEQLVIGTLLNENGRDSWIEICDIIEPTTFVSDINQIVYECINNIYKTYPDTKKISYPILVNTSKILKFGNFLEQKDEKAYLKQISKSVTDKDTVKILCAKLRKLQIIRNIRIELKNIDNKFQAVNGSEKISDLMEMVEKPIFELSQSVHGLDKSSYKPLFTNAKQFVLDRLNNPREMVGLDTGWPAYNAAIGGGLRLGTVNVIASRFGGGKSSISENIGYHIASQNIPILMLDTEMSEEERLPRDLALVSGVTITEIEEGSYKNNPTKVKQVMDAAEKLEKLPYDYRNICGMEFDQVVSVMKNWVFTKVGLNNEGYANPSLIVLDYLKLQSSEGLTKNIAEYMMLGLLTTAFVNFCQQYKVAGLTFAQLNRDGIDSETSNIIAASDRIGWFASTLAFTRYQSEEELEAQRNLGIRDVYNQKLVILKSRHGPGLDQGNYINLRFDRYRCKFHCGPTQFDLLNEENMIGQNAIVVDSTKVEF